MLLSVCGQGNIRNTRHYLLTKISQISRPLTFNEETFQLISGILALTPPEQIMHHLNIIYGLIEKYHQSFKMETQYSAINIYFQVLIRHFQSQTLNEENLINVLGVILQQKDENFFILMLNNYINDKSKTFLQRIIKILFVEYKLHHFKMVNQEKHLQIIALLLDQNQESIELLIQEQELLELIKINRFFLKYIRFYPQNIQTNFVTFLISSGKKTSYDIECLIELYKYLNQ